MKNHLSKTTVSRKRDFLNIVYFITNKYPTKKNEGEIKLKDLNSKNLKRVVGLMKYYKRRPSYLDEGDREMKIIGTKL